MLPRETRPTPNLGCLTVALAVTASHTVAFIHKEFSWVSPMIEVKRKYVLASYSPWGCKDSDTTARTHTSLGWCKLKGKLRSSRCHESDMWSEEGSPGVAHPHGPAHCPTGEGGPAQFTHPRAPLQGSGRPCSCRGPSPPPAWRLAGGDARADLGGAGAALRACLGVKLKLAAWEQLHPSTGVCAQRGSSGGSENFHGIPPPVCIVFVVDAADLKTRLFPKHCARKKV